MATNYQRGQAFEYRVRDLFRKHDYYVIKSAGSKGKADLVALKAGRPAVLIQCKAGAIGSRERQEAAELHALAESLECTALLAGKDPRGKIQLWSLPGLQLVSVLDYN